MMTITNSVWYVAYIAEGAMYDYKLPNEAPWYYKNAKGLVIKEGLTSIGNNAFYGNKNFVGTLDISDSVLEIGINAFNGCFRFTKTNLIQKLVKMGSSAFEGCAGFDGGLVIGLGTTHIS